MWRPWFYKTYFLVEERQFKKANVEFFRWRKALQRKILAGQGIWVQSDLIWVQTSFLYVSFLSTERLRENGSIGYLLGGKVGGRGKWVEKDFTVYCFCTFWIFLKARLELFLLALIIWCSICFVSCSLSGQFLHPHEPLKKIPEPLIRGNKLEKHISLHLTLS